MKNIPIKYLIIILIIAAFAAVYFSTHKTPSKPVIKEKDSLSPAIVVAGPYPSKVLDLTNWKMTLPVGTEKKPKSPMEIRQPNLAAYKLEPWFILTPQEDGVVFRAPVKAPTTSGTKYARSELREMKDKGANPASWSSAEGVHSMFIEEAITAVPKAKQHVVAGQIHDADDDIIVIRLEQPNLYVNVDGENVFTLNSNYILGERFTVKFVAEDGQTKVYYNNNSNPAYTLDLDYTEAYFKAGVYTQSNCKTEEKEEFCNSDNYGEVIIYKVEVTHK